MAHILTGNHDLPVRPAPEIFAALAILAGLLLVALLVWLDTGFRGLGLLGLGALLGAVFLNFQYGFASGWRRFIEQREMMALSAHFLLASLCAILFIPAASLGIASAGSLAPVSVSLFIGAFMFGIGMQLANGCGSGVLFSFGGGSGRMLVALPFFVLGSLLGSLILPMVLGWGQLAPVQIAGSLPTGPRLLVNLVLLAGLSFAFWRSGRRRGQQMPARLLIASVIIAGLCWAVFLLAGHPWGVTFGFTLWGAKLAGLAGLDVSGFGFWQWPGPARALAHSVLADTSSLMDIGMLCGAAIAAGLAGGLRAQNWPNQRQLAAAALGGLLMGVGARLAFGCNIGAFLAGTASGSLHGWIWFVMAMAGSWLGVRLRPSFGFQDR
jgi:hypothetical protein